MTGGAANADMAVDVVGKPAEPAELPVVTMTDAAVAPAEGEKLAIHILPLTDPSSSEGPATPAAPNDGLESTGGVAGEKRKPDNDADATGSYAPNKINHALPLTSAPSLPSLPPTTTATDGEPTDGPAAKKAKTDAGAGEAAKAPASAPLLEVNLGPGPDVAAAAAANGVSNGVSNGATNGTLNGAANGVGANGSAANGNGLAKKTSNGGGRAKREKKPLPVVGKTARKTRSQGPVEA